MTWAEKVKERDGWKCAMCGSTENIEAHHIKPCFLYPECRNDVDNGVTVCRDCHSKCHMHHFEGFTLRSVNGKDPDPEGRTDAYIKRRKEEEQKKNAVYAVWGTDKQNGGLVFEAAKKAGQSPGAYIAESVYRRLIEDGFNPDKELFLPEWKK